MNKTRNTSISRALGIFTLIAALSPQFVFAASPQSINLGSAGSYTILTKTGVSSTGSTAVTGDIGVSPIAASSITGFSLILPSASAFSTSALVTGKIYAADYAVPTPSNLTTAISDMETAYTDGSGRSNYTATELGAGNIGGLTIAPGLYKWGTGVTIPSNVTLLGSANDVWIFQIAQGLDLASGVQIQLAGGAQASNVFWVVAGPTTINTNAVFNGVILGKTAIVLKTGATLNGKALAQTAVTLDSNSVHGTTASIPSSSSSQASATTTTTTTTSSASTGSSSSSSSNTSTSGSTQTSPATPSVNTTTEVTTSTATTVDPRIALQAQLNGLNAQIQSLQGQGSAQSSASSSFGQNVRAIVRNMSTGSQNNDVSTLQAFLISQNKGSESRALANVGATGYFGAMTRKALAEFQANVGIKPASGNFGPITRAYINTNF